MSATYEPEDTTHLEAAQKLLMPAHLYGVSENPQPDTVLDAARRFVAAERQYILTGVEPNTPDTPPAQP